MAVNYHLFTLPNGLRVVHKPMDSAVSYCGFFIDTGTRDEKPNEHGIAHFIEHMLFKGTHKRKAYHIVNRMESVGGELNAYTNKEETVIYSIFLEPHFERAVELISDLVFNSEFPMTEIEKEAEVIIDEIHSYEDSPSDLIYDEFENLIYSGSELGHNILGTPESILTFDTEKVKNFVSEHYSPSNIVFFSLGKTNFSKIERIAKKYFGEINDCNTKPIRLQPQAEVACHKSEDKGTNQSHVIIGSYSYSIENPRKRILQLLNNILGGPGMNSRLNISLREKHGYVYGVESSSTYYTDTGLSTIYFGCDVKNRDRCINLVYKELKKLKDTALTSSQLYAVQKQFKGQIGISNDNKENLALSLGKSILRMNNFYTLDQIFKQVDSITSRQLLDVANEIYDENRLFSLIYN